MNKIIYFLTHPHFFLIGILEKWCGWIPDKAYLRMYYLLHNGEWLHLEHPVSFNEKIQWLKIYDRKPLYTVLVDKVEVKKYVKNIIGEKYIIPTLGVWNSTDDIDYDSLPQKFVLKTTHDGGGGGVIVCDKRALNKEEVKQKLEKSLRHDIYKTLREWPYKNVVRRIMAEEYIEQYDASSKELIDYKFFCFNGEPKFCQVKTHQDSTICTDLFDMNWNLLPFTGINPNHKNAQNTPRKPENLDQMIPLVRKLAVFSSFERIDFYNVAGKLFFGEITFYPNSGMGAFSPREYDAIVGNILNI